MKILKVIAHLLDYPTQEVLDNTDELKQVVVASSGLPLDQRQAVWDLIDQWSQSDLYDLQEHYDGLFERGRYVSLLLFEHVHGESRDRGQAMVDLLQMYRSNGFELDSRQMPDYIPLFLEFLSEQDESVAREWLADVSHILALLEERLQQRKSGSSALFTCLLTLSGAAVDKGEIKELVNKEQQDDTLEAIDREWEEKEVRFDEPVGNSCPASQTCGVASLTTHAAEPSGQEIPVTWHDQFTGKALQR